MSFLSKLLIHTNIFFYNQYILSNVISILLLFLKIIMNVIDHGNII